MSTPLNDQNPQQSALKDGIVIGVLACLREFGLLANTHNVTKVLQMQQKWSMDEIQYYLKFFGLN
jgi:hypothetical protein